MKFFTFTTMLEYDNVFSLFTSDLVTAGVIKNKTKK